MRPVVVGLDVGTTRIKALAVDLSGAPVVEAAVHTPWVHEGAQAQMSAEDLMSSVREVLSAITSDAYWASDIKVTGIGITSMAEAGVLLDQQGNSLAPIIAWHDPRGDVETLKSAIGAEAFEGHVGMRLNSKPSVTKILWLEKNLGITPHRYLSVSEYVAHQLGGEQISELCLVSRTGLFDVVEKQPWAATLDLVGDLLPDRVVLAGESVGTVSGIHPALDGASITVAGMDHHCGAFASGAATSQALFDSLGTAEALLRFTPGPLTREQLRELAVHDIAVMWSVIPDHVCLLAAYLTGLSLERIARMLGLSSLDARLQVATEAVSASRGALKLDTAQHTGLALTGIDDSATPAALWHAAVEDLFELSTQSIVHMDAMVGPSDSIVIAGGWIHDPMVRAAKAAALGDFRVSEVNEAGAMGAAMFAAISCGEMERPSATQTPRWQA